MRPAKKHRIIAAFFDAYVIGSLVQVLVTILTSLIPTDTAGMIWLPFAVFYLLAVIVYHTAFAGRVLFCSPGETMAGCRIVANGKSWFTVYTQSRWFLFLTLFFLLTLPANAFDTMQRANEYPLPMVLGKSVYVCLFLLTIYRIAIGRFRWAIVAYIFLGLHVIDALLNWNKTPDLAHIGLSIFGLQAVFLGIALVVYKSRYEGAEQPGNEQMHAEATSAENRDGPYFKKSKQ